MAETTAAAGEAAESVAVVALTVMSMAEKVATVAVTTVTVNRALGATLTNAPAASAMVSA